MGSAQPETATPTDAGRAGVRPWVNWALALAMVPAAAIVMIYVVGGALSSAACSGAQCPDLGPGGIGFGILFYGAAVLALLTVVVSVFTATRRRGVLVPLSGWALLIADVVILLVVFRR